MCQSGTSHLSKLDHAIYVTNCLQFIQTALVLYSFTSARAQAIEQDIDCQMQILEDELHQSILSQSGLYSLISALVTHESSATPLSRIPELDPTVISDTMSRLDGFLCTAGIDASSRVSRITSSRRLRRCLEGGVRRFLASYSRLYEAVMDPKNKYEFPATLMTRSVEEIETLLAVI
jgi:hypothetical protein